MLTLGLWNSIKLALDSWQESRQIQALPAVVAAKHASPSQPQRGRASSELPNETEAYLKPSADELMIATRIFALHVGGHRAPAMARDLLRRAGSLAAATQTPPERLKRWGIDPRVIEALILARQTARSALQRRMEDRPLLPDEAAVIDYLHAELAHLPHEELRILYLNGYYRLLAEEAHSQGMADTAVVSKREILHRGLEVGAVYVMIVHNHPGGDHSPSRSDIEFTRKMRDILNSAGMSLIDHLIISRSGHASMLAAGYI